MCLGVVMHILSQEGRLEGSARMMLVLHQSCLWNVEHAVVSYGRPLPAIARETYAGQGHGLSLELRH